MGLSSTSSGQRHIRHVLQDFGNRLSSRQAVPMQQARSQQCLHDLECRRRGADPTARYLPEGFRSQHSVF
jgi:hypothetical protein